MMHFAHQVLKILWLNPLVIASPVVRLLVSMAVRTSCLQVAALHVRRPPAGHSPGAAGAALPSAQKASPRQAPAPLLALPSGSEFRIGISWEG